MTTTPTSGAADLPDECEMLKHALWLASSFTVHRYLMSNAEGRWSGAEKATCHDELCCLYVAVFRGVEVDRVRVDLEADWMAVHDATQELTDHMDVVIGFPLKGVPDYDALAPKFFAYFHRLAAHALRASHGQAPAGAWEPTEQQILEAAFAPAQPAAEASRFGSPELQAMIIARCVEKDQADSVLEDAACEAIEKVLALFPFNVPTQKFTVNNGPCLTADNDDEFYSVKRVLAFLTEIKTTLDAARKQGGL